ncbi:hypothetical protein [Mycolicibacterium vaccae]|uniref:Uncharacterized protein n=1 Tax=Mycolicibacterium vaccae ATCC 25954 TaxID=1194972 RepID=K0UZG0_MYCVA|nr:hypothetical protein [Mycolicibacterium vaccae]ANI38109.1 hypothetical protein MYVA_0869 [Mycolicibacterium vaccae 95051]EJZ12206.1 hypothetical protein MVAC_03081 [Mycolicibacterium vaccae ATCC 25954]
MGIDGDDTVAILADQARLKRIVSYSDLNSGLARRGHVAFNFDLESDRAALGHILGDAVQQTIGDSKVMLSAIVAYLNRNDAGPGGSTSSPLSSVFCRTRRLRRTSLSSGPFRLRTCTSGTHARRDIVAGRGDAMRIRNPFDTARNKLRVGVDKSAQTTLRTAGKGEEHA